MPIDSTPRRRLSTFVLGGTTAIALALALLTPWRASAAPGVADTTFVPVTACRLADTRDGINRLGPADGFGPRDTTAFRATGTNGNCIGIPTGAVAVAMNVTALAASEQTFLTFWPGGVRPIAAGLTPSPGRPPTANAITTALSGRGTFEVYNHAGTLDVVIDVTGYYVRSSLVELGSRIGKLEAMVAELERRLDALGSIVVEAPAATDDVEQLDERIEALDAELAATDARLDRLDAREPFSVSAGPTGRIITGAAPATVVELTTTAPVAGSYTAVSAAWVSDVESGKTTTCSLTRGTAIDSSHEQVWQGPSTSANQIAGTRRFPVGAGERLTIRLVCARTAGNNYSVVNDAAITAVFTPNP